MKFFETENLFFRLAAVASLFALAGCGKASIAPGAPGQPSAPIITQHQSDVVRTDRPSANPAIAATTNEVKVTLVVDKQALLGQEFLYGADLQYSSMYDKQMDLYQQSLAVGHVPANFRIVGDELQLIANNTRLFPSEVNHPEQLITRFKILSQTEKALTISGADSRIFLAELLGSSSGNGNSITDPTAKPPRDLWVRSFDFVPKGNYLLQQTSVILDDGTIAEMMESIFPRSSLAPGKDFQQFEMNPDDPVGADSGPVARFRFLPGETNFKGEHKFTMSEHYDISKTDLNPEGTIDWYVTPNITDEEIKPVKLAVEGWNRYFKSFKGIERDVVRFKGRLPEGIHLGDPRFNVINWDSRLVAGAAYETQAVDPATGKQSHSLIYMPAAWLQIGFDYWKNGQYSETKAESVAPAALAQIGGLPMKARLACVRDIHEASALLASARVSGGADVIKEFGNRLLKDTLFHEVGHSLGLAHNFKGSLSFDRADSKSLFSTSIMDYNDYEIELGAFDALDSAGGPQLAYDRQAIDAIYNKGVDIEKEPTLPACNDNEADNEDGGVDPLCIRYDVEKDPTASVVTALDRISLATKAGDVTMAESLSRVPGIVLTQDALASVKSEDDLEALASKLASSLKGSAQFYLLLGKASLAKTIRLNIKSLLQFADDVLPDSYDEKGMRERVFRGVQQALALKALPAPAAASLAQAVKDSLDALSKTPYLQGLAAADRAKATDAVTKLLNAVGPSLENSSSGLPKVRATVLASLARHTKVPFFFGKLGDDKLDFEASLVGILGDTVTASGGASNASRLERLNAAQALATYRGRAQGDAAIAAAQAALTQARATATDNASRELIESLLGALKPATSGSSG